jgi:predicted enzyme related to lactoylglutathione lyase
VDDPSIGQHKFATFQLGMSMAKITGIGGVFFKTKSNHKALADWYQKHLGLVLEDIGSAVLKWRKDKAEDQGVTVWHIAEKDSQWFSPSNSSFMVNYRVDNLNEMIKQLQRNEIEIIQGPEFHENGEFAWILDPDGNKIELWEPMIWNEKNKRS